MKTIMKIYGITLALTCGLAASVKGQNLYVANSGNNSIGEYTTSGATVSAPFITGFEPYSIAISGGDLFVVSEEAGTAANIQLPGRSSMPR